MQNFDLENIKSHPSQSLAKAKASRDLQINFNQAEDPLTISTKLRGDNKYGSATQSGRSMIEMLGVLAIIGVLSVGGIAGYSKAMMKYRINKAIEQITLIAGNVRTFFGPQKDYIGVSCNGHDCDATNGCVGSDGGVGSNGSPTYANNGCPIIKKAKILPDEMITLDATGKLITAITNHFGGAVDLYRSGGGFCIVYDLENNMEACIELVTHDWTNAGVKSVGISNEDTDYFFNNTSQLTLEEATNTCSGSSIAITLGFDTTL